MTNTGPPRASGGQQAPAHILGKPALDTLPQAAQVTGPPPGSAPSEEDLRPPRPAAALIDIALLIRPLVVMGAAVGRSIGHNSVQTGFGPSRSWAASDGPGQAKWA